MKYTIISRDELIKLIKFGFIYQGINYIFDEKNKDLKIEELLKTLPYDDELGFVIVEFTYDETSVFDSIQTLIKLDIKNIISIYCLSNQAFDFYKTKFNPNIKFKLFENLKLIEDVNKYKVIEDKKKGVKALFEIFKIDLKINQDKLNEEYIQELLDYKDIGYLEQDFRSFYHDMFCYERKNSFFKEDIGFLSDVSALNKMENIRKEKSIFLSGNYEISLGNPSDKDKKLKEHIDNTLKKLSDNQNKNELMNKILIGTIFLKSKNLLDTEKKEKNYWNEFLNLIHEFKNDYSEESKIALWYIGVFLGYKYLYDDYYKQLDLNIFKEDNISENNTKVIKEVNPLELELEKIKSEKKELMKRIQELENTDVIICPPKETEQSLTNNTHNSKEEQIQNDTVQINELKKQIFEKEKNETKFRDKILELEKYIESIPKFQSNIQENEQLINSEITISQKKELYNSFPIEALREIYFRGNKSLKMTQIKKLYTDDNKEKLIDEILKSSHSLPLYS